MNDSNEQAQERYFQAAASWDADSRNAERLSLKRYKALGIGAVVFAAIMGVAVTTLLPLKEFVPIIIRVENATGAYDVKPAGEKLDVGESRNEKIVISDVARYIKAREGFTRGEAEENYKMVYLMSCGTQRAEWDNYINPQLNKKSPVLMLTNQDSDRITVQSVTFLQSLDEDTKTAQVQFEKTVSRGTTPPLKYRYVATLGVRYDPTNIPSNQLNFYLNPFGFCTETYRRDQVGNPVVVNAPGTPNQELNQVMEDFRRETDAALAAVRAQQQLQASQAAAAAAAVAGSGTQPTPALQGTATGAPPALSSIGMNGLNQSPAAAAARTAVPSTPAAPVAPASPAAANPRRP